MSVIWYELPQEGLQLAALRRAHPAGVGVTPHHVSITPRPAAEGYHLVGGWATGRQRVLYNQHYHCVNTTYVVMGLTICLGT